MMISWFSLLDLRDALTKPGCPICQIRLKAASRYIGFLLHENVSDVDTRIAFWAGMGYCPDHTRLLAEIDQKNEVKPTGMNILYESLTSFVKKEIGDFQIPEKRSNPLWRVLNRLLPGYFPGDTSQRLTPKSICRVCQIADENVFLGILTLMQCLEDPTEKVFRMYRSSDGICLAHLRMALHEQAERYPSAALILKEHALNCLSDWEQAMGEYIRKQAWQYRHEKVTEEEKMSLRHALSFFSGYSPEMFSANGNHETEKVRNHN